MKIEVPIKEIEGLISRKHIVSATMGDDEYDISLSGGCVIFEFPNGKKYGVLLGDLLQEIIKMKKEL